MVIVMRFGEREFDVEQRLEGTERFGVYLHRTNGVIKATVYTVRSTPAFTNWELETFWTDIDPGFGDYIQPRELSRERPTAIINDPTTPETTLSVNNGVVLTIPILRLDTGQIDQLIIVEQHDWGAATIDGRLLRYEQPLRVRGDGVVCVDEHRGVHQLLPHVTDAYEALNGPHHFEVTSLLDTLFCVNPAAVHQNHGGLDHRTPIVENTPPDRLPLTISPRSPRACLETSESEIADKAYLTGTVSGDPLFTHARFNLALKGPDGFDSAAASALAAHALARGKRVVVCDRSGGQPLLNSCRSAGTPSPHPISGDRLSDLTERRVGRIVADVVIVRFAPDDDPVELFQAYTDETLACGLIPTSSDCELNEIEHAVGYKQIIPGWYQWSRGQPESGDEIIMGAPHT